MFACPIQNTHTHNHTPNMLDINSWIYVRNIWPDFNGIWVILTRYLVLNMRTSRFSGQNYFIAKDDIFFFYCLIFVLLYL
jgi:hypothetical protein